MIIKVCGLRDGQNIRAVEKTGVQWFGFIFYEHSPRYITEKPSYLPATGQRIGVFVTPDYDTVMHRSESYGLHAVQLHGKITVQLCTRLRQNGLNIIRSLPASPSSYQEEQEHGHLYDYLLFDTPCPSYGGSGRTFNWNVLTSYTGKTPFLLSGGLAPDCIERLRTWHHPRCAGLDLNSGFETAPALKDAPAIKSFIHQLKHTHL